MNKIILMGRLTADPELRTTASGKSIASFNLAVQKRFKSSDHPEADFFSCVAWQGTGEFISKYFAKGNKILVVGELHNNNYENNEGQKIKRDQITVAEAYFVESKKSQNSSSQSGEQDDFEPLSDEEMPF